MDDEGPNLPLPHPYAYIPVGKSPIKIAFETLPLESQERIRFNHTPGLDSAKDCKQKRVLRTRCSFLTDSTLFSVGRKHTRNQVSLQRMRTERVGRMLEELHSSHQKKHKRLKSNKYCSRTQREGYCSNNEWKNVKFSDYISPHELRK